jgi:hypothetical protein
LNWNAWGRSARSNGSARRIDDSTTEDCGIIEDS